MDGLGLELCLYLSKTVIASEKFFYLGRTMTLAYWCVLAMILYPYFFAVIAKISPHYKNRDPRHYLENTTGWRKRAHYIQLNSFEAAPAFGLAVIIAHLTHAPQLLIDKLAIGFVIARVLYSICYLTNRPTARSLTFTVGLGCVIGLFCIGRG